MQLLRSVISAGINTHARGTLDPRTQNEIRRIVKTENPQPSVGILMQAWEQWAKVISTTDTAVIDVLAGTATVGAGIPDLQYWTGEDFEGRAIEAGVAIRALVIEDADPLEGATRKVIVDFGGGLSLEINPGGKLVMDAGEGRVLPSSWHEFTLKTSAAAHAWVRITALVEYGD